MPIRGMTGGLDAPTVGVGLGCLCSAPSQDLHKVDEKRIVEISIALQLAERRPSAPASPSHPARMGNQPMTTAWKVAREAPLSFLNAIEVAPGFLHVTSSSACPFFRVYAAL
jgi:hypothetical protein